MFAPLPFATPCNGLHALPEWRRPVAQLQQTAHLLNLDQCRVQILPGVACRHTEPRARQQHGRSRKAHHHHRQLQRGRGGGRGRDADATKTCAAVLAAAATQQPLTPRCRHSREKAAIFVGLKSISGMTGESWSPYTSHPAQPHHTSTQRDAATAALHARPIHPSRSHVSHTPHTPHAPIAISRSRK